MTGPTGATGAKGATGATGLPVSVTSVYLYNRCFCTAPFLNVYCVCWQYKSAAIVQAPHKAGASTFNNDMHESRV